MKSSIFIGMAILFAVVRMPAQSAADFHNAIATEHAKVTAKNLEYISFSVHSQDALQVEQKRKEVVKQLQQSTNTVGALQFKSGEKLKAESLNVLKLQLDAFQIDFPKAAALKQESESSYEAMEAYFKAQTAAEQKLERASDKLSKAQQDFAKENDMEFVDDPNAATDHTANSLQRINQVNEYARSIFLVNFKVAKASAAFMDAVQQQKGAIAEVKRETLALIAKEATAAYATIPDFRGNTSYRDAAKAISEAYHQLANNGFKAIVTVLSKKQSELTEADVNAYNAAIEQFNTQIPQLTETFNQANVRLLQQNIPDMGGSNKINRL